MMMVVVAREDEGEEEGEEEEGRGRGGRGRGGRGRGIPEDGCGRGGRGRGRDDFHVGVTMGVADATGAGGDMGEDRTAIMIVRRRGRGRGRRRNGRGERGRGGETTARGIIVDDAVASIHRAYPPALVAEVSVDAAGRHEVDINRVDPPALVAEVSVDAGRRYATVRAYALGLPPP